MGALGKLFLLAAAVITVQGASLDPHRPRHGDEGVDDDTVRLAAALGLGLPSVWPQHTYTHDPRDRVKRSDDSPDSGSEDKVEAEGEGEGAADDEQASADNPDGENPPPTGLRRWVIRVRNFMFGRRDLEGTETGEEEGQPEQGRTWLESLAHWFAHGIKRVLVRISGPEGSGSTDEEEEGEGEGGESGQGQEPGDASEARDMERAGSGSGAAAGPSGPRRTATAVVQRIPKTTTTERAWTALPPHRPTVYKGTQGTAPSPRTGGSGSGSGSGSTTPVNPSFPAGTVYDGDSIEERSPVRIADDALESSHPMSAIKPPVEETNELN